MKNYKKILKNFITTVLVVCFVTVSMKDYYIICAAENKWVTEGFELPAALRGACTEYIDGKLYVIGGDETAWHPTNTVRIYDFTSKIWTTGTSMPLSKSSAASYIIDGKIYIFGGRVLDSGKVYTENNVDIYDPIQDIWYKASPMPYATAQAIPVRYKNKIYFFSGIEDSGQTPHTFHRAIQIYDIKNNTWTIDTNIPFMRYGYSISLMEDKVYIIGGGDHDLGLVNNVDIYDLTSNTWSEGTPMKYKRHYSSSVAHNNKIYVFGGYTQGSLLKETEVYDIVTNTWSMEYNLSEPKHHIRPIVIDNKIFILGGETSITPSVLTAKIETLQLPSSDNHLYAHLYTNEETQLSFSHSLIDNQKLSWKSSDTRVATVNSTGMVTALEAGTTYISAYNQEGIYLDYIPVIVTENDIYRMAIHLNTSQSQKLYIKGNPSDTELISMDNTVATVDNNGLVTSVGQGLTLIKATLNEEVHYIYIRVN